ncbi:hypothetical protein BaRGS_00019255, partial [Batillaria attramentaria]
MIERNRRIAYLAIPAEFHRVCSSCDRNIYQGMFQPTRTGSRAESHISRLVADNLPVVSMKIY